MVPVLAFVFRLDCRHPVSYVLVNSIEPTGFRGTHWQACSVPDRTQVAAHHCILQCAH